MPGPFASLAGLMPERLRDGAGRRASGFLFALLVEALLVLVLLTLGHVVAPEMRKPVAMVSVNLDTPNRSEEPTPEKASSDRSKSARPEVQVRPPDEPQPVPTQPAPEPPAFVLLPRGDMAALDISRLPSQPSKRPAPPSAKMGPVDTGSPADSVRVGSGPNGEALYAASWYREPYDDELKGYLSTAEGPGWGLIACRTVPDYRVDDCVALDEYPTGSRIARAVLAAAWQFRVRPPRLGGRSKVGEWVRIRIDYGINRR